MQVVGKRYGRVLSDSRREKLLQLAWMLAYASMTKYGAIGLVKLSPIAETGV